MEAEEIGIHDLCITNSPTETTCAIRSQKINNKQTSPNISCYRCGGPHNQNRCKFKESTCFKCQKVGHISKVCRSRNDSGSKHNENRHSKHSAHAVDDEDFDNDNYMLYSMYSSSPPIYKTLKVNGTDIKFQIDTGASISVMSKTTFQNTINVPLQPSSKVLKTYTGETVKICGEVEVEVIDGDARHTVPIVVVEKGGPPLLGRNWLKHFHIDCSINNVANQELECLLEEFSHVFKSSAGCLKDVKVKLHTKPEATPKFCRARQPPYALRDAIEEELSRLQRDGILQPVEHSEWATPIVPVRKKDGSVRICGDYKLTVNKACEGDCHPIPRVEDLAYALSKGDKYSKLDLSHAYTNLQLDEKSRELTTINTHKGLFTYHRLCFGISAAPGIFQRIMESIFRKIPGCVNYMDDIYVTGKDDADHLNNLRQVLATCEEKGLSLRREKCEFLKSEVAFLGYRLNKNGLYPLADKITAIRDAPQPRNVQELRSLLGLVNFYGKFVPNVSQLLAPLYILLRKGQRWQWGKSQESALAKVKSVLSSDRVLVHFRPDKKIIVECDASPYGVGAILKQLDDSGNERPVAYASRALNEAERKYSQLDREGLGIIFAVKKFNKYLVGRHFTIVTDHKPLLGLFGEEKKIPEQASARVQRWAIILSAHSYSLIHRPGRENAADALSRLPLPYAPDENDELCDIGKDCVPEEVKLVFETIEQSALSVEDIAKETQSDKTLCAIYKSLMLGLPIRPDEHLRPFSVRLNEMSVERGCILWGTRVVIPPVLQSRVMKLLHDDTHVGVARMKAQARSWVWWPQIDADIEKSVRCCSVCQKHRNQPAKAPLFPWEWPEEPWNRVHLDFAGPFLGHMYLVATDAHSKWVDIKVMNKITTSQTILELRDMFSTLGLPETIVTDNGPSFTSSEFRAFMSCNGIKHITVSPYHPSSNGLAERSVQTFKKAMIKVKGGTIRERVCKFLTKYRCTPHSTTGLAPAELMFGRNIRTHIDLLHPNLQSRVVKHQMAQKLQHDKNAVEREVSKGDSVLVRNFSNHGDKWIPGVVVECSSPLSFKIRTNTHGIVRRHLDQVRTSVHDDHTLITNESCDKEISENMPSDFTNEEAIVGHSPTPSVQNDKSVEYKCNGAENQTTIELNKEHGVLVASPNSKNQSTRSGRVIRPPLRYRE